MLSLCTVSVKSNQFYLALVSATPLSMSVGFRCTFHFSRTVVLCMTSIDYTRWHGSCTRWHGCHRPNRGKLHEPQSPTVQTPLPICSSQWRTTATWSCDYAHYCNDKLILQMSFLSWRCDRWRKYGAYFPFCWHRCHQTAINCANHKAPHVRFVHHMEYSYTVGHVTMHTSDPAYFVFDQQILELPPQRRTATRSREVSHQK